MINAELLYITPLPMYISCLLYRDNKLHTTIIEFRGSPSFADHCHTISIFFHQEVPMVLV
jgi:hypothetical protein